MHRYRIVAQIALVLSILNLVLAAPIVMREIHEARDDSDDETVVAENGAATPKKQLSSLSTSSGYPTPHLSSDSSESGYSWLLDRPPRLSPHDSGSFHLSSLPPPLPLLLQGLPSPPSSRFSRPGSSGAPASPALSGLDRIATETSSPPPEGFTPSRHSSSLSSISWNSDGSPPTETPRVNSKFFDKNMNKKVAIVVGVAAIVGGTIGGIVGSQIKHRDCEDG